MKRQTRKPPFGAMVASGFGTFLLAIGITGLINSPLTQLVPALADRTTVFALIAVGLVIEIGAVVSILQHRNSSE